MVDFIQSILFNQILDSIEKEFIISKTDPKGRITYANDLFCKISGYTREELIGKPHNIVRHPDMPKSVFKDLWDTIKEKKKPWKGLVKNKTKDGGYYWVVATVFPIFDPDKPSEVLEYISIRKEVTDIMDGYEKDQLYSKLYEILSFYYISNDLKLILNFALERILKLPWLEIQKKGGIMLWNEENQELEMYVSTGVGESLLKMCDRVPKGRCLCGRAAQRKEIVFKDCVDEEHENRPAGMAPHGHYNIPLMHNQELLGVLFLYVEHGHKRKDIEVQFLNLLGNVLGSIIYKFKLQTKLEDLSRENFSILQYIKSYSSKATYSFAKELINKKLSNDGNYHYDKYFHLLFLDIVNFTGFSEKKHPKEVIVFINLLFGAFIDKIYEYQGDIDKFIGDAIFSYFTDANQCLQCALEILEIVESKEFNPEKIQIRIGIHSGYAIHTNLGNDYRKDFTLIGDTVNTTQRLEKACKPNSILVSETFLKNVDQKFLQNVKISKKLVLQAKNKKNPIFVYLLKNSKVLA
ncbi:MAG: adenylate/guanylate cyclase domain-containing protein [Leptonema sp. (in: bacteria)]